MLIILTYTSNNNLIKMFVIDVTSCSFYKVEEETLKQEMQN